MPDNKDKLKELHSNLIKDNYDLPKYDVFEKDMSDPKKLSELHDNLVKDDYDLPDINTFKRDMGFGVDFKPSKDQPIPEKPKSTSIFGEMLGPTRAVGESTIGQKLQKEESIREEVAKAPERKKKAVDTTLQMWADQNNVDINSPKAKKQKSIYEQGIDSKEFSVSYGQKGLQLVRNVGPIDGYISALKQSNDIIEESDNVKAMTNEEAIRYSNKKIETEEIMPERATGILGAPLEFLGGATRMLTKQSAGSLLATSTALLLAPETGGASLAAMGMLGGTIALAPDMMKQNYISELDKWYRQGKKQGMSDEQSMGMARTQAERAEKVGIAEAVGFAVGGKAVGKIFSKPVSGTGVKNAMWNAIKTAAPEAVSVMGISGGSAVVKDVSAKQLGFDVSNKQIFDDAFDSASEGIKFMGAMAMFHGVQNGISKIPKFAKSQLKSYINSADPGVPETVLDNLVENNVIKADEAENTKQALAANKQASKVLEPLKIDDEYIMGSLTGKQEKKIKLQNEINQLKENNVSVGIKEKEAEILKIDQQMSNIHDTGDVEANEKDTELPAFQPGTEPAVEPITIEDVKNEQESKSDYTIEQKTADELDAQHHGFDNQYEALNSIEKRTGIKYEKYQDIPKEVIEKSSEERSPEIKTRNAHTDALNETIKILPEHENDARSAGLREQTSEGSTTGIPRATEVTIGEKADISQYRPEQQQHITETSRKLGGDEQSRKLFDTEGEHEWGESYEEFLLRKGC